MSSRWTSKRIGSLCSLVNGRAFKPTDWGHTGLPIVRIQNLNNAEAPHNYFGGPVADKNRVASGDVLLSWSGTPGTSFGCFIWDRGPAVLNQHIFRVEIDSTQVDKEFFVHAVNSRLAEMISLAHGGVGLRHITKGKLESITLPVPPLAEQQRIAGRIKALMQRVDELETLREEIRVEVEHLPMTLSGEVERAHNWRRLPVGKVVLGSRNGRSIRASSDKGTGYVLTLSAVRGVYLDPACRKAVVMEDGLVGQFCFRAGDVFVSRSNTRDLVGLSAVALEDAQENTIYPDLLIKLTADPKVILARYLALSLRFPSVRDQIRERAKGTSQSMVKISGESLKEVSLPVPPLDEQPAIIAKLERLHGIASEVTESAVIPYLVSLRSAVLRKAFAGEL